MVYCTANLTSGPYISNVLLTELAHTLAQVKQSFYMACWWRSGVTHSCPSCLAVALIFFMHSLPPQWKQSKLLRSEWWLPISLPALFLHASSCRGEVGNGSTILLSQLHCMQDSGVPGVVVASRVINKGCRPHLEVPPPCLLPPSRGILRSREITGWLPWLLEDPPGPALLLCFKRGQPPGQSGGGEWWRCNQGQKGAMLLPLSPGTLGHLLLLTPSRYTTGEDL